MWSEIFSKFVRRRINIRNNRTKKAIRLMNFWKIIGIRQRREHRFERKNKPFISRIFITDVLQASIEVGLHLIQRIRYVCNKLPKNTLITCRGGWEKRGPSPVEQSRTYYLGFGCSLPMMLLNELQHKHVSRSQRNHGNA